MAGAQAFGAARDDDDRTDIRRCMCDHSCHAYTDAAMRYTDAMRIALGADHAGVQLKEDIKQLLDERGIAVHRLRHALHRIGGLSGLRRRVARDVAAGRSIAASWSAGPASAWPSPPTSSPAFARRRSSTSARRALSREHNDANVLALGERLTPPDRRASSSRTFLDTPFAGGRHQRRVDKIAALDHCN